MLLEISNTKESRLAMLFTAVFHILVVLLLVWLTLLSPDPPIELKSIPVSLRALGDSYTGSGESQAVPDAQPVPNTPTQAPSTSSNTPQNSPTQQNSPVQAPDTKPKEKPSEAKEPEQQVDPSLNDLFGTLDDGNDNSSGQNTPGGHEGTNDGSISGKGVVGDGSPIGYNLMGRDMVGSPSLDEDPKQSGIVVFDIYVRKDGTIKDVKRNYSLSNTSSDYLFKLGEKALETVKFNKNDSAPPVQYGTFTFNFKLK
ncbi:MAG: hypothetical protein KDC12_10665 [Flavobacteriales bacterium]|nr:hypothetical protein [Flavobacteriales bacterium]